MTRFSLHNILQQPLIKRVIDWSKSYSIKGFKSVPLYDIVVFVVKEAKKDNLTTRANSVAYSFFLSIFPALIFIFTLIPYVPVLSDYTKVLIDTIEQLLPASISHNLTNVIRDLINIKREGLLSLGILMTLYVSSNGMLTLMFGFDKTYHITFKQRGYLRKRLIAIGLTMLLGLLFVLGIVLLLRGEKIIENLSKAMFISGVTKFLISFFSYSLTLISLYTAVTIVYKFGSSMVKKVDFFNLGSIIATTLIALFTMLFAYFVNNFARYNEIYGSIGALIALLVWLQIIAFILLVGFELNAAIAVNRDLKNISFQDMKDMKF